MDLEVLEVKSCKFTWLSNPCDEVITKEKLHKLLANCVGGRFS